MAADGTQLGPDTQHDELPQFAHELAHDVVITGKLTFPSNVRIDGRLNGEVRAEKLLVIGTSGVLRATVYAERLVVFGTLQGDVRQSLRVELKPGSHLIGSIETCTLVVHEGAILEGRCSTFSPAADVPSEPAVPQLPRPTRRKA
jgi:cytoskeletal protein CcmA (bactofilin family)